MTISFEQELNGPLEGSTFVRADPDHLELLTLAGIGLVARPEAFQRSFPVARLHGAARANKRALRVNVGFTCIFIIAAFWLSFDGFYQQTRVRYRSEYKAERKGETFGQRYCRVAAGWLQRAAAIRYLCIIVSVAGKPHGVQNQIKYQYEEKTSYSVKR